MQYNIIIIGGGIVGLTLANALALKTDCRIAVLESTTPNFENRDGRVSAITPTSKMILQQAGAWPLIESFGVASYEKMNVFDTSGSGEIQFSATDIHRANLGFIVENRLIAKALWQVLTMHQPRVDILCPMQWKKIQINDENVEIQLDNEVLSTHLLIAADGANSAIRNYLHMDTRVREYGHTAIIAAVICEKPHENTAWQCFSPTGPAAFLPLQHSRAVSLVWSQEHAEAQRLLTLSPEQFNRELTRAFEGRLGDCRVQSPLQSFPLFERHATHYVKPRFALIGDAAHTLHPLAGQGLNLGLLDVLCFVNVIVEARANQRDYASLKTLRRYERWRKSENAEMLMVMQGLKQLFASTDPYWVYARSIGLNTVNRMPVLKNFFSRYAGGA